VDHQTLPSNVDDPRFASATTDQPRWSDSDPVPDWPFELFGTMLETSPEVIGRL
jgi:hypothetical protein